MARRTVQSRRRAHPDEADDHSSDSGEEGPPDILVGLLLPEPPRLSLTKQGAARMIALVGMHLSVNYLNVGSSGCCSGQQATSVAHERVGVVAG